MTPDKPHARPKTPWSQPLADLIEPCIRPALASFGFNEADLLLYWPDIVGARLAARCEPLRLQWPPRRDRPGVPETATLVVRVEGAFAIELQHQAPTVIERINGHAGWRCVGRLALRQGPLAKPAPRPTRPAAPDIASVAHARDLAHGIVDDGLREALARLGARAAQDRDAT